MDRDMELGLSVRNDADESAGNHTGSISGTAQLIGNLTFGGIFNVYGSASATFVSLNGQDPTLTYAVTLQGTLTTPGTMEGFYSIYKIGATAPKETGTFILELLI